MKRNVLSIYFSLFLIISIYPLEDDFTSINTYSERIYSFNLYAFGRKYEVYFTKNQIGYYKYDISIDNQKFYLTYEGKQFYNQCTFDENIHIEKEIYPMNIWTNNRGELLKLGKRYAPVIDKNKERKNYPYSFGKNR
mgnify:CR=1 FL=1